MRGGADAREQKRSSVAEGDYSTDQVNAQRFDSGADTRAPPRGANRNGRAHPRKARPPRGNECPH